VKNYNAVCAAPFASMALAALFVSLLQPCCSTVSPSSGDGDQSTSEPLVLADIHTSSEYYDYAADSFVADTCLCISIACIGSPMPRVQSVLLDGNELTMHSTSDVYLGFMRAYARNVDLYSAKTLSVVTDGGTASAQCAVPPLPPYVVSPPYGSQLTRGTDQLFEFDGACEYYRLRFSFMHNAMFGVSSFEVILDTIVTAPSFILPGRFTDSTRSNNLYVAVKGYNGALPFQKGALANMTGSAYGFVYAYNTFNNSWDSEAVFSFPNATIP
jgi:hypothetical protein